MSAARQFFDAISKAKRDRAAAEQADVAGLDYDDLEDDEGDELADREDDVSRKAWDSNGDLW